MLDCDDRLSGLNVLVVDDEPDARRIVARFLIECGAKTAVASSAADAHRVLDNFAADVIVSDIGMPEQDGYDLILLAAGAAIKRWRSHSRHLRGPKTGYDRSRRVFRGTCRSPWNPQS